ncbi:MAG: class I SAM-dependent methyltransferase [Verrucomicrobia bacterium]|nr:class I SAM-dependent methyltransferase [Verrucomicrobiota bacterium]
MQQQDQNVAAPKICLKAEREVACSSPDHLLPWGTRWDNSQNRRFNDKLYKLYPRFHEQLKVLDMGCSGGGFVKSCFDDGCLAVGLEGSDFSKRTRRAEWRTIPEFLFTCDVTGDFEILIESTAGERRLDFDVVTCWEMMEHIAEPDVPKVVANVKKHLAPGALWIMSVSPNEEVINGVRLHQTVRPKDWWAKKLAELGLLHLEAYVHYFNTQFIRGPKYNAPGSFHLVVSQDPTKAPSIPHEGLLRRLHDLWLGSVPQRVLSGTYV